MVKLTTLADKLKMSNSTASGIIERMQRDGLITRERSDDDRRTLKLALTEKGNQQYIEMDSTRLELFQPLLELTEQEQSDFLRIQNKIIQLLIQIRED